MRVMAKKGCVCPMDGVGGLISDSVAVDVPETSYYRRRIADGSLIHAVHAEPPSKTKQAAGNSAAQKAEAKDDK